MSAQRKLCVGVRTTPKVSSAPTVLMTIWAVMVLGQLLLASTPFLQVLVQNPALRMLPVSDPELHRRNGAMPSTGADVKSSLKTMEKRRHKGHGKGRKTRRRRKNNSASFIPASMPLLILKPKASPCMISSPQPFPSSLLSPAAGLTSHRALPRLCPPNPAWAYSLQHCSCSLHVLQAWVHTASCSSRFPAVTHGPLLQP